MVLSDTNRVIFVEHVLSSGLGGASGILKVVSILKFVAVAYRSGGVDCRGELQKMNVKISKAGQGRMGGRMSGKRGSPFLAATTHHSNQHKNGIFFVLFPSSFWGAKKERVVDIQYCYVDSSPKS